MLQNPGTVYEKSTKIPPQKVSGLLPDAFAAPPLLQARREVTLQRVDIHKGMHIYKTHSQRMTLKLELR